MQTDVTPQIQPKKLKLLDQVREIIRLKHYSIRTEQAYIHWIRSFILFHRKRHPAEMQEAEVTQFLTHLAMDKLEILRSHAPQPESLAVSVNGVPKAVHAFKTGRNQMEGLTRCYFVELAGETKAGAPNQVTILLPIRTGLVFSGAYIDLPDQMPPGE